MYTLRTPAPPLRPFLEHYWFVSDADGPIDVRIDAYVDARPDLVFPFGATYTRTVIGGDTHTFHGPNLDAQRTVPLRIHQAGQGRTTGVRFHLGGLAPFTTVRLRDLTNRTPPPSAALGDGVDALTATLSSTPDPDAQAQALDAWFLARLRPTDRLHTFRAALDRLRAAPGDVSVPDLADHAGCSVRQVERLFAHFLGIPPKTTARILRFQTALRALMQDPGVSLAEVAHAAGYYDQAHFIRDFRTMTGGVPRGYRGYYPPDGPSDFAPNVVVFVQDEAPPAG